MNQELIIEHYLSQLDRELQALPTGQRAEIITEIRSHILDKSAADSSKTIQAILNEMGTPREVATRYLEQKGVKPWTPSPARNWIKWIAISFAAMFAFSILATFATIWYFSPLVHVDEKAGRVTLLGGMIDVNEHSGEVKIGSMNMKGKINIGDEPADDFTISVGDDIASRTEGEEDLAGKNVKLIKVPFNNAKLELNAVAGTSFKWECKNYGSNPPPLTVESGVLTLDLLKVRAAKCELSIPQQTKIEVKGINGSLNLDEIASDMDISVTNGKVNIRPDDSKVYDFEVKVKNGSYDNFPRSTEKTALKVKVDIVNGVVRKE